MITRQLTLIVSLVALLVGAPNAFARGAASPPVPEVMNVDIDASQGRITLNGRFFKVRDTVVMLGSHRLAITTSTPTQVVARLPDNLRPATYRLLIGTPPSYVNAKSLYVQIPLGTSAEQMALSSPQR